MSYILIPLGFHFTPYSTNKLNLEGNRATYNMIVRICCVLRYQHTDTNCNRLCTIYDWTTYLYQIENVYKIFNTKPWITCNWMAVVKEHTLYLFQKEHSIEVELKWKHIYQSIWWPQGLTGSTSIDVKRNVRMSIKCNVGHIVVICYAVSG